MFMHHVIDDPYIAPVEHEVPRVVRDIRAQRHQAELMQQARKRAGDGASFKMIMREYRRLVRSSSQ